MGIYLSLPLTYYLSSSKSWASTKPHLSSLSFYITQHIPPYTISISSCNKISVYSCTQILKFSNFSKYATCFTERKSIHRNMEKSQIWITSYCQMTKYSLMTHRQIVSEEKPTRLTCLMPGETFDILCVDWFIPLSIKWSTSDCSCCHARTSFSSRVSPWTCSIRSWGKNWHKFQTKSSISYIYIYIDRDNINYPFRCPRVLTLNHKFKKIQYELLLVYLFIKSTLESLH